MNNEKKLPYQYMVIIPNEESELFGKFKKWYTEQSGRDWDFSYEYYGKSKSGYNAYSGYLRRDYTHLTIEEWDSIVNPKQEKQPLLKVGDMIPEYLNYKINFTYLDGTTSTIYFNTYLQKVDVIDSEFYWVSTNNDPTWKLKISEVDALIEEHERELEKTVDELFPMDDENNEQWEPKNGEEVEVSDNGHDWKEKLFVGINPVKNTEYKYFATNEESGHVMSAYSHCRKKIVKITKTYSEIAQLLGCDVEQLQIIKD